MRRLILCWFYLVLAGGLVSKTEEPGNAVGRQAPMSLEQLTQKLKAGQPVVFATFGDSITWPCFHTDYRQNYITFTVEALRRAHPKANIKIVHAGNMGTAGRGLADSRFDKHVLAYHPDAVFIMFGMNDCGGGAGGLDAYDRNLTELIHKTRQAGALPIVLTQNEILYDSPGDGEPRKALPLYRTRALAVAAREKTPCADCTALWTPLLADREQLVLRLNDAIHPNLAGHRLLAKGILKSLWPEAARFVSDAARTPLEPGTPAPTSCLLPGHVGKQLLRTEDGLWIALSGRRRGAQLTDLVVSFSRKETPRWSDFQHVTLVGAGADAVFDFQERTLTAGLLLERQGHLTVVFSWNVGVFYVTLDRTKPDWEQRLHTPRAWMEQTRDPFLRPTTLYKMNKDGSLLYDAFLQPDGTPAIFCKDFQMAPKAGFEVVEGQDGIALVCRAGPNKPPVSIFFPVSDAIRGTLAPTPGSQTFGMLVDEGGNLRFEAHACPSQER